MWPVLLLLFLCALHQSSNSLDWSGGPKSKHSEGFQSFLFPLSNTVEVCESHKFLAIQYTFKTTAKKEKMVNLLAD